MTTTYISNRIARSLASRAKKYCTSLRAGVKTVRSQLRKARRPQFFIFILGCQRSGTTLLERIFRQDMNSAVFGEFSELSIDAQRTVWRPLDEIKRIFDNQKYEYAVARPLFESDRAAEIVAYFRPSVAVWVYRDFRYVVNSMLNKWQGEFFNISRKVEADSSNRWRLEETYQDIKREAIELNGWDNSIKELYALYWLRRNQILFEESLSTNHQVLILDYTMLVSRPKACIDKIIKSAGGRGVWNGFATDAKPENATKQINVSLSAPVATRCEELMVRLNELGQRDFGGIC